MSTPLSELKSGESFEARDPAGNLQYVGFRGAEEYRDSFVTVIYLAGGVPGSTNYGAHRLEEIQQACDAQGVHHQPLREAGRGRKTLGLGRTLSRTA